MNSEELLTIKQCVEYAKITARGLRKSCARGNIPGARKMGRDWVIPLGGLNYYLNNRPRRGRKPKT